MFHPRKDSVNNKTRGKIKDIQDRASSNRKFSLQHVGASLYDASGEVQKGKWLTQGAELGKTKEYRTQEGREHSVRVVCL